MNDRYRGWSVDRHDGRQDVGEDVERPSGAQAARRHGDAGLLAQLLVVERTVERNRVEAEPVRRVGEDRVHVGRRERLVEPVHRRIICASPRRPVRFPRP